MEEKDYSITGLSDVVELGKEGVLIIATEGAIEFVEEEEE